MIKILTINESKEWDEIVKTFSDYDVYYLSGYVKAFQKHGDGIPLLFYYEDSETRGINVVMKRDISEIASFRGKIEEGKYYDFSTPYGYGGWLIEGNNHDPLFNEYITWCKHNHIVSEFVRFHPVLNNSRFSEKYYDVVPLGETVSIDTSDKEVIWNNFTSKNRNVIRKAINNGVEIKHGLSEELLDSFIAIYNKTMDKDSADKYYYFEKDFYNSILYDLPQNATVYYALLNNTIIAASIILFANGKLNYHLSGSLKEYQHLAPTNLLLWKVAEWGNEIKCISFHLGGGVGSKEDSLFKFKRAFYRGELCRYCIGKIIFDEQVYDELTNNVQVTNESYFPKYRG